jgi:hypothetical protein
VVHAFQEQRQAVGESMLMDLLRHDGILQGWRTSIPAPSRIFGDRLPTLANQFFNAGLIHPFENGVKKVFDLATRGKGAQLDLGAALWTRSVDIERRHGPICAAMFDDTLRRKRSLRVIVGRRRISTWASRSRGGNEVDPAIGTMISSTASISSRDRLTAWLPGRNAARISSAVNEGSTPSVSKTDKPSSPLRS